MKQLNSYFSLVSIIVPVALSAQLNVELVIPPKPISFLKPPRLLNASTTSNRISAPATYYFTIVHPPDAREPFQKVMIKQATGGQSIRFNLRRTQVFHGSQGQLNALLPAQVTTEQETLVINLTPPVAPGTVFTLALRPIRNPDSEGIYFLGVTAFPTGTNVNRQFLGFGRLHFHRSTEAE